MNDAPVDVGIQNNPGNAVTPVVGKPLPIVGLVCSSITSGTTSSPAPSAIRGQDIDNSDGQAPNAFKNGQYMLGNLLYTPVHERDGRRRVPVGPPRELLRRLHRDDSKLQFSFKYNFSCKVGG